MNYKLRTNKSRQLTDKEMVPNLTSGLDMHMANFIHTQIRLKSKTPKGRRFNLEDKVLALILQKQS